MFLTYILKEWIIIDNLFKLTGNNNPKIKSKKDDSKIKLQLSMDDLKNPDAFEHFISGCENAVRKDPRYANYREHLMSLGFNRCSYFSKMTSDQVSIEMHHGPIFTMYDICSIVADTMLENGEKITTFKVADAVLTEHEDNHIQVTMLCKTAHQLYHAGKIFVNHKQAVGDVMSFIKNYKKGIKKDYIYTFKKFLELCEEFDSTDNDMLSVKKKLDKIIK